MSTDVALKAPNIIIFNDRGSLSGPFKLSRSLIDRQRQITPTEGRTVSQKCWGKVPQLTKLNSDLNFYSVAEMNMSFSPAVSSLLFFVVIVVVLFFMYRKDRRCCELRSYQGQQSDTVSHQRKK